MKGCKVAAARVQFSASLRVTHVHPLLERLGTRDTVEGSEEGGEKTPAVVRMLQEHPVHCPCLATGTSDPLAEACLAW